MTHKQVLDEQRAATREILIQIEDVFKKYADMGYRIEPEDYHLIRAKVKSKIFRISNRWHEFFATVVDAKFRKKINEPGEIEETHLSG